MKAKVLQSDLFLYQFVSKLLVALAAYQYAMLYIFKRFA